MTTRLPTTAHTLRSWRIHAITRDFHLEDVWTLPTPGGPNDFSRLLEMISSLDLSNGSSAPARALFALRWKLGELFGWDADKEGLGSRVPTLEDRLPADLLGSAAAYESAAGPFKPLYATESEWAAEIANGTVHGILHLSWVPDGSGGYRGQMAVLVKPNGLFGTAYMTAIKPFRYLIVYPAMLRQIGREWRERDEPAGPIPATG
jgi:hypothetical protein